MEPSNIKSTREVYFDPNIIKDSLHPLVWNDALMVDEVREKLLDIGKRFHAYLKVDAPIIDVILTGSLANYNWTSASDLDVHVIIDYSKVGSQEFAQNLLTTKRVLWNRLRKNVRVRDFEVELYPQSHIENHRATGQFSLLHNRWNVIPQKQDIQVDEQTIKMLIALFTANIHGLSLIHDNEEKYIEAVRIKDNLLKLRRASIEHQGGEFAIGNLVFKALRSSNVMSLLFDCIASSYDQKLSLSELNKLSGQLLQENNDLIRERIKNVLVQSFGVDSTK